jgi:hypothetical protein
MSNDDGRILCLALVSSVLVACGSVTPLGTGTAGADGGGQAGAMGSAGAAGGAGASGGATGSAGAGSAGATGSAGMSGRVPAKHRPSAVACSTDRPAGACMAPVAAGASAPTPGCTKDSDCTAGSNGRCLALGRVAACSCSYDLCTTDADCAQTGGPCACRPDAQGIVAPTTTASNICLAGDCRVDADCGAEGYCSPSLGSCGAYSGVTGYYCHTPTDACVDDADCTAQGGGDCRFNPTKKAWDCEITQCVG